MFPHQVRDRLVAGRKVPVNVFDILVQSKIARQQTINSGGSPIFDACADLSDVDQVAGEHAGMPSIPPRAPAKVLSAVKNCV